MLHADTLAQMSAITMVSYLETPASGNDESRRLGPLFHYFGPPPFVPHPSMVQEENKRDAWWYAESSGTYLTQPV